MSSISQAPEASGRWSLDYADSVAASVRAELLPHCLPEQCEIAGSVRRRRPKVGDIEVVCVPRPYNPEPLLRTGVALVLDQWETIKGHLPCRYTRRRHPSGMFLDVFMVDPRGFGLQLAIRTGSAAWSHQILAKSWVRAGYRSEGGLLRDTAGRIVPVQAEQELFRRIGLAWVDPADRELLP
jgi:DNA polymerase (family 10)